MVKRRIGIIAFILCVYLFLMPCSVHAASTTEAKEPISTDQNCSLTISCCSDNIAFLELPVRLYKIADVSEDYQYMLTPSFEKSNLILNGIQTVGEWNVIRSTLETYIFAEDVAADFNTTTDPDGAASFDCLKPGLYLAVIDDAVKDETTYIFDSALIALPGLDMDGLWQYNLAVKAKSEILPPVESDEVIEFRVTKLWKGDSGRTVRPKSIEVEIFRNGKSYETVSLSSDNNWTYSWKAKDDNSDWKVIERNIPSGYTMTVEKRETSFILTNIFDSDNPNEPNAPQTGDTLNVMFCLILMTVFGSAFIILGITRKKNRV